MKVIEELYVSIEEFDYELKENGCLQLLADISITGLCDEERIEDEEQEEETAYTELEVDSAQEEENRPTPHVEEPAYKESDEWEDYAFEPFQLEERKAGSRGEEIEEHEFVEREEEKETTPQFELFGRKISRKNKRKKKNKKRKRIHSEMKMRCI